MTRLCGAAAQSQSVLQQQMEAASAAASQYKQQAQETGRLDSFKQQVCVYNTSSSHLFAGTDKAACLFVATQACLAFKTCTLTCCNYKAGVPAQGDITGGQPARKPGQHTIVTWGQH